MTDRADLVILIAAAGAASRMRGADKLLEPVAGLPLLRRLAEAALTAGGEVAVALPPPGDPRRAGRIAALAGLAVTPLDVTAAAEGLSASIRAGAALAEARDAAGLLVLLGDMPEIGAAEIAAMTAAFASERAAGTPPRPLRGASAAGKPGHPVLFPRAFFTELGGLGGDAGAREILKRQRPRLVPLPGEAALTDLDTPEDWAAWRAARPRGG